MPRSRPTILTRKYGGPFHGLVNSLEPNQVGPGALVDGAEFLVQPGPTADVGRLVRRRGSAIFGANTGVLEMAVADATMRGLQAFEITSESLADDYPELCVLFADESKRYAQYWLRTNSVNYTVGEEFGSTHYPTTASTASNFKLPAMPYDGNGATGYSRGAFEENRRRLAAGTRRRVGVGSSDYGGAFYATPYEWYGRRFNTATGSGSENLRWRPMGHYPPLWCPTFPAASYPTRKSTAAPWGEGTKFFATVLFEMEDGSLTMPCLPRDINATLTSGLGLVTVDDDGDATAEYFDFIPWRNIPIGPPGTKRRWLARSNSVTKTQVAAGAWPNPTELFLCGVLENNYQTSYDDPNGDDDSLGEQVRLDHMWPWRARYAWTFDQRVGLGYLRPNPCAIIIAPAGATTAYDINLDEDATPGSSAYTLRVTTSNLELKMGAFGAGSPGKTSIALSSTKSLQTLVDEINATTAAGVGDQWVAQLAPGADGTAPSTELAPTVQAITCGTTDTDATVTTAASFADVAEGMKVTGTGIPAGAYVKSKTSNTSLELSANATATNASVSLTFHVDAGDDGIFTDSEYGNIRCYCAANPQPLALKQTWLDRTSTDTRGFMFTAGAPGEAPFAANSFFNTIANVRSAEADAGTFMGAAALRNGCVMFYSKRIGWFVNEKSGGTGEDQDYRLRWLEFGRGCISPYTVVQGNGWVGCLTQDGFWLFDGSDEMPLIITRDIFDRAPDTLQGKGELAYAILVDSAEAAKEDGTAFKTHAHYADGRLWLKYPRSSGVYWTLCYDATPSVEGAGLAQMRRGDGSLYGWSLKLSYNWRTYDGTGGLPGCIGSVRKSDGLHLYSTDDTNDKTNCGLVFEFEKESTYTEGGVVVVPTADGPQDYCGTLRRKSLHAFNIVYRHTSVASNDASVSFRGTQGASFANARYLDATGASETYTTKRKEVALAARSARRFIQWEVARANNASGRFEVDSIEIEYEVLNGFD